MKILQIIPSLQTGGAERLALDICIELNKREAHEVQLVVFQKNNNFEAYDFIKYIPAKVNLSLLRKNQYFVEELQQAIDDFQPDIIHSHLFLAEIVSRSCYYPKAKWFSHFHDNMPQLRSFNWKSVFNKRDLTEFYEKNYLLNRYSTNGGNQFIAISNDAATYAANVLPKRATINFLKNAINYTQFYNEISLLSKSSKIKLINVGSFQKKKNQQFLLDIVLALKKANYQVELTLLGNGAERQALLKKVQELNIENEVFFAGNVNNVSEYLSKATFYIHSAYYEPFGLVLLEAMAAGLPVITLDGKGNRDLIEEGKNGYMIYEQNAEKFAERIIALWKDNQKMLEISNYAQQYAKQYDIVNYVEQLLGLYQNAIDLKED